MLSQQIQLPSYQPHLPHNCLIIVVIANVMVTQKQNVGTSILNCLNVEKEEDAVVDLLLHMAEVADNPSHKTKL